MNSLKLAGAFLIFVAGAVAQSKTYTFNQFTFNFNPLGSACSIGNAAPQTNSQGETLTVNLTCTDTTPTFTAAGTFTLSFSATSVTGTIGAPLGGAGSDSVLTLSTPLTVSASTSLTYSPGTGSYSEGAVRISGGVGDDNSFCYSLLPGTNPEKASLSCSLTTLDIDPATGNADATVELAVDYGSFSKSPTYVIDINFKAAGGSTGSSDLGDTFTANPGLGQSCTNPSASLKVTPKITPHATTSIALTAVSGSSTLATATGSITCKGTCATGSSIAFTLSTPVTTTANGVNWLTATSSPAGVVNGSTPTTVTVAANASSLPASTTPYVGHVIVSGSFPSGQVSTEIDLTVLPADSIAVVSGGSQPAPGTSLDPTKSQTFTGTLKYALSSVCSAYLELIAYDQNGKELSRSPEGALLGSGATGTVSLTIPSFTLPVDATGKTTVTSVSVVGKFVDVSTGDPILPNAISAAVTYPVSRGNSISITQELPIPSEPVVGLAAQLPPFCASGVYTYNGPNKANIYLVLLDSNNNVVGRSPLTPPAGGNEVLPGQSLNPGTNETWGAGCAPPADANQLIFIPPATMPNFGITSAMAYNKPVGTLNLQAQLFDSVTSEMLATSSLVPYTVEPGLSASEAKLVITDGKTVTPVPVVVPYPAFAGFLTLFLTAYDRIFGVLCLDVTLSSDLTVATMGARITAVDQSGDNTPVEGYFLYTKFGKGVNQDVLMPVAAVLDGTAKAIRFDPYITFDGGSSAVDLNLPTPISFETISATGTPDPLGCNPSQPGTCLIEGTDATNTNPATIAVSGAVTAALANEVIVRTVTIFRNGVSVSTAGNGSGTTTVKTSPVQGQRTPFSESVPVQIPGGTDVEINITYQLHHSDQPTSVSCSCPTDTVIYRTFAKPVTVPATSGGSVDFVGGVLNAVKAAAAVAGQTIQNVKKELLTSDVAFNSGVHFAEDIMNGKARPKLSSAASLPFSQAAAIPSNPPYLPIASSWSFTPSIPNNGSFSATISLDYSTTDFPDNPNFSESKLQVISFDSTGTLHTNQTTLDLTNKIASATVTDLDPIYSLAVIGPFSQTSVMLATAPTSYALLNTGSQATDLSTTVYQPDGTAAPAVSVLSAGHQQVSTGPAWVQAWANPSTVAGVSWLDNGAQFAVTPAINPDQIFILTDIEYNATTSTEIDLTNTSLLDSNATVNLFGADGSSQGAYTTLVAAKNSISARVDGMFPSLTTGFIGYLSVISDQPCAVSGIRWSGQTATGLAAQPVNNTSLALSSWYYPQLASGVTTTLHIVNTNASAANLTLKAWPASGSGAAAAISVPLASGHEYTAAIATIFGKDPAGSIEVDSDTPGVYGDVLTMDASLFPTFAVSIPLNGSPVTSSVLPYATTSTTVYVFNPNSSAATVTVTPYNATGTAGTRASVSVPAHGDAAIGVNASAYATISATQPVVAAGWMVVPSGTTTGYLALPAAVSSGGGIIGPINGGGTTLEFGEVPIGSSATGTLNISNTTAASQTISAITATDPQFTVVSPTRPFNITAGSQQAITIQFAPTASGEQSAQLTIAGASVYAPVSLLGIGTGSAAATSAAPAITTLNPSSANAGSTGFTLTINGSGFTASSMVMWNSTALPTTFISATQLTANVPANLLATTGSASITVSNSGVASSAITFTINPVVNTFSIASLSPAFAVAGSASFILTINGTGFTASSVVMWNSTVLPTTFVNATQITASVPANLIATSVAVAVSVGNGGVNSNALFFDIALTAPGVISALPHFAAQNIWTTGIFAVNTGNGQANFSIAFRDDNGHPLALPFLTGTTSTLTGTLPPLGSAYYETGNPSGGLISGWGQVAADPSIVIQALFRENSSGTYYEAAVPSNSGSNEFEIPFDATTFAATGDQFFTGFAIANFDSVNSAAVTCTARDQTGTVIPNAFNGTTGPPQLSPLGHWSGYLFPALTGKRGTIDCVSNTNIAATALRFIGSNAFSSLPVIDKPASASPATSALPHFAAQNIWTTGIFVVNTGSASANFAVAFHDDNGNPVAMPFNTGTASTLTGALPARGSAYYETGNPTGGLLSGWGQITSDPTIVVQALFREAASGSRYYEAAVPSNAGSMEFEIPFDATTFAATGDPFYTGFAIANLDVTHPATVTCTARDPSGTLIPNAFTASTGPPQIAASGHWAGYLFPVLTGRRGTIDCVSNTTIAATALRFIGTNAFSSLPVINK